MGEPGLLCGGMPHGPEVSRPPSWVTARLAQAPTPIFVAVAIFAAFSTYFAMYAFRKPFAAATFEGQYFFGTHVGLKTAIVISQIIGYAMSKYIGIKVCSEVTPGKRARLLIGLVVWAQVALVLYGVLPNDWKFIAIFLNGLPLGMIWGLVVWYLEGRRTSELLLAGLSLSYILASGVVKDFGRALMAGSVSSVWNSIPLVGPWIGGALGRVSEGWMPAVAGFHFLPIFLGSVWLLNQLPRPNTADVIARVERKPMKGADRLAFVRQFAVGLTFLCVAYFFLTAYRDFRDNYQVEIFDGLGYPYKANTAIITKAESIVTFGVMAVLAALNLVKDNRRGLLCAFGIMSGGVALLGVSTALLQAGLLNGFWWMTLTGLGSYLAYVPYGSVLFDRLIASTRVVGTAVFAIYLADAIGYTGSVGVQLYKDLIAGSASRTGFFVNFTWFMSALGLVCLLSSAAYFARRTRQASTASAPGPVPGPTPIIPRTAGSEQ